jgi:hypothetical protein
MISTRLSSLQYPMLKMFAEDSRHSMSVDDAQHFDQRPFRSMLVRKWVAYKPGKGFHATKEGVAAYQEFLSRDITRKNPMLPLTAYFDPVAYGLSPRKMKRKKAEAA